MPNFKPIKQPRISDEVFNQLKESILSDGFKAGDKLPPERELADQFQVSRVAIREAIRTLENAGFVEIRQGSTGGAYVTDLTFEQLASACLDLFLANKISIHELHQVRILIEPEVTRLATINATPESNQRLVEAFEAEHPRAPVAIVLSAHEPLRSRRVLLSEVVKIQRQRWSRQTTVLPGLP